MGVRALSFRTPASGGVRNLAANAGRLPHLMQDSSSSQAARPSSRSIGTGAPAPSHKRARQNCDRRERTPRKRSAQGMSDLLSVIGGDAFLQSQLFSRIPLPTRSNAVYWYQIAWLMLLAGCVEDSRTGRAGVARRT